jgi:hypothetical protein
MSYAIDTDKIYSCPLFSSEDSIKELLEYQMYRIFGSKLNDKYMINKNYNFKYYQEDSKLKRLSLIDDNIQTLSCGYTNMSDVNRFTLLYCANTNVSHIRYLLYLMCIIYDIIYI